MKTYLSYITIFTLTLITAACGKLDYENKEFYKQEVYHQFRIDLRHGARDNRCPSLYFR